LEIEFENRLKEQNEKKQKIVFVIDELDKIQESESFPIIKEYKNLFTRSFAHFIFIAGDESYDYTNADRQDKSTGTFPTLFTHVFYLQLPSANELEEYLDKIFNKTNDNTNDISPLKKYLLYRS